MKRWGSAPRSSPPAASSARSASRTHAGRATRSTVPAVSSSAHPSPLWPAPPTEDPSGGELLVRRHQAANEICRRVHVRMVEGIERDTGVHLELEALVELRVEDNDADAVRRLASEQGDLDAVALAVGELATDGDDGGHDSSSLVVRVVHDRSVRRSGGRSRQGDPYAIPTTWRPRPPPARS